jgi:hypothetical protein
MWYLYTMEFYSATKNKICHSQVLWIENIIWSEVSQTWKAKIVCSPFYADYRPKTNAVTVLEMGHIIRETAHRRKGKET